MNEEKHTAALIEVREAIDEALRDPRGLLPRQRRIMSMLSLGTQHIVELWLHKNHAIKPGAYVKHEWLKAEDKRLALRLAGVLTKGLEKIKDSDKILALARGIEHDRNDVVYGAPLANDLVLKEKINAFLELKKAVEDAVGELKWE